ncbi:MAG: hypothetical protein JKY00_13585 [Roseicyclus sp.]|nr:hypothetical protein [Roseicyclus sp.]
MRLSTTAQADVGADLCAATGATTTAADYDTFAANTFFTSEGASDGETSASNPDHPTGIHRPGLATKLAGKASLHYTRTDGCFTHAALQYPEPGTYSKS